MRALWFLLASVATAHAQAPGDTPAQSPAPAAGAPGPAAGAPAPVAGTPATPPATPAPSVMNDRWSVAIALASEGLTPKTDGASNVQFGGLELSARYRITPPIEVALSFLGGGSKGDLSTVGLFADFRYRFYPEHVWNFYALGGLGIVAAADKNATDADKKGRGALSLGIGGERRFGHLAIYAELRVLGVAANKDVPDLPPGVPHTVAYDLERYGLSGGALVAGGAYYF